MAPDILSPIVIGSGFPGGQPEYKIRWRVLELLSQWYIFKVKSWRIIWKTFSERVGWKSIKSITEIVMFPFIYKGFVILRVWIVYRFCAKWLHEKYMRNFSMWILGSKSEIQMKTSCKFQMHFTWEVRFKWILHGISSEDDFIWNSCEKKNMRNSREELVSLNYISGNFTCVTYACK